MSKETQISLDKLIAEGCAKKITRRLFAIHDQIEKAIATGFTHEEILASLKEQGFGDIKLGTFKVALHRIRKKKESMANDSRTILNRESANHLASPLADQQSNPHENRLGSEWPDSKEPKKMISTQSSAVNQKNIKSSGPVLPKLEERKPIDMTNITFDY